MSKYLTILLLCFGALATRTNGQGAHSLNAYLPVSGTTERLSQFSGSQEFLERNHRWRVGAPALGLSWMSAKGRFWEVILHDLQIRAENSSTVQAGSGGPIVSGAVTTTSSLQLFLLRDLGLWLSANDKWSAQLGLGAGPYSRSLVFVPKTSASFPQHQFDLGATLVVAPRLRRSLGGYFMLELSTLLPVLDARYRFEDLANPLIPSAEQRTHAFYLETLPAQLVVQVGVRYLLH